MADRPPRLAVRVDASAEIGSGHARRCFVLAQALQGLGAQVVFVARALDDASRVVFERAPGRVILLPPPLGEGRVGAGAARLPVGRSVAPPTQSSPRGEGISSLSPERGGDSPHAHWARVPWQHDADQTIAALADHPFDWLLIDHYAFDARWHARVADALRTRIAVIDDLGDRALRADLLIDPNLAPDPRAKYAHLLTGDRSTRMLTGPRHALLAPVFRHARRHQAHDRVRSIGIFLGATDPSGATGEVLRACLSLRGFDGEIEVVASRANPRLAQLQSQCVDAGPRVRLSLDLPDLAAFHAGHDLQVGAGGGAQWERCCIGAPTVALEVADNQRQGLQELARRGAVLLAQAPGRPDTPGALPLAQALQRAVDDPALRRGLCDASAALVDGRGAERVALALLAERLALRRARMDDAALLHRWRNDPATRATAFDAAPIPWPSHQAWMEKVLTDPSRHLLVAQVATEPVGCLRWDVNPDAELDCTAAEVSLYLDPALTGLGLGGHMLSQGEAYLARLGIHRAHARVRADNAASAALFRAAAWVPNADGTRFDRLLA